MRNTENLEKAQRISLTMQVEISLKGVNYGFTKAWRATDYQKNCQ
jgi:hypothetical protein